jgi:glucokinase
MIGIGVDIGGTFVKFLVLNEKNEVLYKEKIPTDRSHGKKGFIEQIGAFINRIKEAHRDHKTAVAVGVPGDVDDKNGILRYNPNLRFEDALNWPIADELEQLTGIRPHIANDANLAAWGIYETDLKREGTNILVVTLGTGVGGGLILNKELYQGSHGSAGEIGHMKIAQEENAPLCGCGARGCLEAFVGTIGIKRRSLEEAQKNPDSVLAQLLKQTPDFNIELIARAAAQGCKSALKVWEDTGYYLGVGISNFGLILDLDTLVLAGGVSGAADYFMPSLRKVLGAQPIKTPFKQLKILTTKTPDSGGIGAALYALHQEKQP